MNKHAIFYGNSVTWVPLPEGTRMVTPPPARNLIGSIREAIATALEAPLEKLPLSQLVTNRTRVSILFDDFPGPMLPSPADIRHEALFLIITRLLASGVRKNNIHLICASGLNRLLTPIELQRIVGRHIYAEFQNNISCHNAEDRANIEQVGRTSHDEPVEINKTAFQCELLIPLSIIRQPCQGGFRSIFEGISTYSSIKTHLNRHTMASGGIALDPLSTGIYRSYQRKARELQAKLDIFSVEIVPNMNSGPDNIYRACNALNYQNKGTFGKWLSRSCLTLANVAANEPKQRRINQFLNVSDLAGVFAGNLEATHRAAHACLLEVQRVTVSGGPADILILGLPNLSPYHTNSALNPLFVRQLYLGNVYSRYIGRPLVRDGGVIIIHHPLRPNFDRKRQPAAIDFFQNYLLTKKPLGDIDHWEAMFAQNKEYRQRYLEEGAFHGVHPILQWHDGSLAEKRLGKIIVAGGADESCLQALG
jgi:hypothetical protein